MPAGNSLSTSTNLNFNLNSSFQITGDSVNASTNGSDFYSFRLSGRSSFNLALKSLTDNGDVNVELLNSSGATLSLNNVAQKSENGNNLLDTINIDDLSAGQYYIRIHTNSSNDASYSLNLNTNKNVHSDIVWRNYGGNETGGTLLWTMNGTTPVQTVNLLNVKDLNWRVAGTGDFNGDGQSDLVWRNYGTSGTDAGKIQIWTMNGTTPVQTVTMPFAVADSNWRIDAVADFNSDGQSDLVWRNYGTSGTDAGKIQIWTMNGTTPVQKANLPFAVADVNWQIEAAADLNRDGRTDLVWRNYGTSGADAGKIQIWTMNGATPIQTMVVPLTVADRNWRIEGASDFNGDTHADLLWRNYGTSGVDAAKTQIWLMNGVNPVQTVAVPNPPVPDVKWQIEGTLTRYSTPSRIDLPGNTTNAALNVGTLSTKGTYDGYVGSGDANDYYQFTISKIGNYSLSLKDLTGDANLELIDSNGNVVAISQNSGNTAESIIKTLSAGNYYARVTTAVANANYKLVLEPSSADINPPVLDLNGSATGNGFSTSFTEGAAPISIVSNELTISDFESTNLVSATVTITNLQNGMDESLFVNNSLASNAGISTSYTNGVLTLTGKATLAQYQEVLRTVTYSNISDNPGSIDRSISFTVSDGVNKSAAVTSTVAIQGTNDTPIASDVYLYSSEDSSIHFTQSDFTIAFYDVDGDSLSKIKITALPTHGSLQLGGVDVQLDQEIDASQLDTLVYVPKSNYHGSDSFGWSGSDGAVYGSTSSTINLSVDSVDDPAIITDFSKSGDEDGSITFSAGDFSNSFSDQDGSLSFIRIHSLPQDGSLKLNGVDVASYQEIAVDELNQLSFVPSANFNGKVNFAWVGSDGTTYTTTESIVTLTIKADNDAPIVSNISLLGIEDSPTSFSQSDFSDAFKDVDGDNLSKIKITALPTHGKLQLSGVDVQLDQEIEASLLNTLIYAPDNNYYGSDSFSWSGSDGTVYASTSSTVSLSIDNVDDPAAMTNFSKLGDEDSSISFSVGDFSNSFGDPDNNLSSIKITSLPRNGSLQLNGVDVAIDQEIAVDDLNQLSFVPTANFNGAVNFTWVGSHGTTYTTTESTVTLTVKSVDDPSVISKINLTANEDSITTFSATDFSNAFSDLDGSLSAIKITSLPNQGSLRLNGSAISNGQVISVSQINDLTFVPTANYSGMTSFSWSGYDGTYYSATSSSVNLKINPVNDAPFFLAGANQVAPMDAGAQTITGWTNDINAGPADEAGQSLSSIVVNVSDPTLFAVLPTVDANGTLRYTPAVGVTGTSSITLKIQDDGGTAGGGVDTSAEQTFTITIGDFLSSSVNQSGYSNFSNAAYPLTKMPYDFTTQDYLSLSTINGIQVNLTMTDGDTELSGFDYNRLTLGLDGINTGIKLNLFSNDLTETQTISGIPANISAILTALKDDGQLVGTVIDATPSDNFITFPVVLTTLKIW